MHEIVNNVSQILSIYVCVCVFSLVFLGKKIGTHFDAEKPIDRKPLPIISEVPLCCIIRCVHK
jgi:hypothetical protein